MQALGVCPPPDATVLYLVSMQEVQAHPGKHDKSPHSLPALVESSTPSVVSIGLDDTADDEAQD